MREMYGSAVPMPLRWLGCFGIELSGRYRSCLRFRWGEFSPSYGIGLSLDNAGPDGHGWMLHITLLVVQAFIYLPFMPKIEPREDMHDAWGFSWKWGREWGRGDLFLYWRRCTIIHMPWAWDWVRTSYLMRDGKSWASEIIGHRRDAQVLGYRSYFFFSRDLPCWEAQHNYNYVLRSGAIQQCTATIKISEREWRWRALKWLPRPRKVCRTLDVEFSAEVGERSGSWKGGTVGCSYDLRPGETPVQCLTRMESEREF